MIEYIREIFIGMINQSTWMDSQAKVKAIDKVKYRLGLDDDCIFGIGKSSWS